jgi:hypothetical protein
MSTVRWPHARPAFADMSNTMSWIHVHPATCCAPDGIAELWFDTVEDETAFFASELGRRQREDGRTFVGFSTTFIVDDHEFDLGTAAPGGTKPEINP